MKKIPLLLLALSACATVPVKMTPDEAGLPRAERSSARVTRELQVMAIGAMPRIRLAPLVFGTTIDLLARGSIPSNTGDVLCAVNTSTATWQSAASCGLATSSQVFWTVSTYLTPTNITTPEKVELPATGSSTSAMTILGFDMPTNGQAVMLQMGDANVGWMNAWGKKVILLSYHGIVVHGAQGGAAQTFATGAGTADASMEIDSGGTGGALKLDANAGGQAINVVAGASTVQALTVSGNLTATAGTNSYSGSVTTSSLNIGSGGAITFSGATTKAVSAVSCAAATCTSLGTATITGAAVTGVCMVPRTTTAGAIGTNGTTLTMTCGVTAANTVTLYCCNPSATTAQTLTGTYAMRVIQ